MRFPYSQRGTVSSANTPMRSVKIPNGNAAPAVVIHSLTKKVQANDTTERAMVVMTKQSAEIALYESISCCQEVSDQKLTLDHESTSNSRS